MTSESATADGTSDPGRGRPGLRSLPLWGVLVAAAMVVVVAGLREVQDIIAPIFLIITLVITVQPLRRLLVRARWPNWLASVVVLVVILLMMAGILGAVVWSLTQLILQLPKYEQAFETLYLNGLNLLSQLGVDTSDWRSLVSQIDIGGVTGAAQSLLSSITSGVTTGISLTALLVLTAVFMAFDGASGANRLQAIKELRPEIAAAFLAFAFRVRRYWIVTTVFGLIVAVLDVIALGIIGVPFALTWGVLAFVTNYIPNVGFVIGVLPPALIAFLDQGWRAAVVVIIVYSLINFVIQTLIQPRFVGDAAGITATVAFISLIFWASILGWLGALLAVPATLFVKTVLIDYSESSRWFGKLITSEGMRPRREPKPAKPAPAVEVPAAAAAAAGAAVAPEPASGDTAAQPRSADPSAGSSTDEPKPDALKPDALKPDEPKPDEPKPDEQGPDQSASSEPRSDRPKPGEEDRPGR